jgi:MYXO-CTERM domain-containing protein
MRFGLFLSLVSTLAACSSTDVERRDEAFTLSNGLVISQVHGAGGLNGSPWNADYIELFNRGTSSVSLNGLSLQRASAAGTFGNGEVVALPNVSVPPGGYYLVGGMVQATGAALSPAANTTSAINMSQGGAKMAIVNGTSALNCGGASGNCTNTANIIDFFGMGNANNFEGTVGPTLDTNARAAVRKNGGCTETNNNSTDFEIQTWVAGSPPTGVTLHNSASTPVPCTAPPDLTPVIDDAGPTDDGGVVLVPDMTVVDLTVPEDLTEVDLEGADLTVDVDMVAPPDLSVPEDLLPPPDLSVPADLLAQPDLVAPADLLVVDDAGAPVNTVVISQVYGSGGNSGALLNTDYLELFNRSLTDTVNIGGWSVQYAAATSTFSQRANIPANTMIGPGRYYLIALASGTNGAALPAADLILTGTPAFNMSATAGKVALVRNSTTLACGSAAMRCNTPLIADLIGYGATATDFETAFATAASSASNAIFRRGGGCLDSDDNKGDTFVSTAAPRNASTPMNDCSTATFDAGAPADLARPPDLSPVADMSRPPDLLGPQPPADLSAPPDLSASPDLGGGNRPPGGCSCDVGGSGSAPVGEVSLLVFGAVLFLLRRRRVL